MRKKLEVVWSEESAKQTDEIIRYLEKKWSSKAATDFLDTLANFEDIVSCFPELYPLSGSLKGFRKAVIVKQVSVVYRVDENKIKVHTLFINRQDPDKFPR